MNAQLDRWNCYVERREKSLEAPLPSDPFANVGGATDQQNAFVLAREQEPDRRQIDQGHFLKINLANSPAAAI